MQEDEPHTGDAATDARGDAGRARDSAAMSRFRESVVFAVILTALLCLLHRDAVFGGKLLLPLDILGSWEPWASEMGRVRPLNPALTDQIVLHPWTPLAAHRMVDFGEMTLWNPFQGAGTPLHANTLSAQLYPLMWLHALFPRQPALLLIGLAKGLLAGLFLYLLLRRRGASPLAAGMAGCAFPLSGFLVVWLGHQHTAVASLLPMLLWLVDRAVDRRRLTDLAMMSLVCGATMLAGHMETALHVLLLAIAYASFRCLALPVTLGRRLLALARLAGGFILGALLAMIQVLPFGEYTLYSTVLHIRHHPLYRFHNANRDLLPGELPFALLSIVAAIAAILLVGRAARASREERSRSSLVPAVLALAASALAFTLAFRYGMLDSFELLVAPDYHGNPLSDRGNGFYGGYLLYVEMNCGYASVVALMLAIVGMANRRRGDKGALFWTAVLFVSLAVVFEWPVIAHMVSRAPFLAEAKNKRALLCASLAALVLAAKGIDALLRDGDRRPRLLAAGGAVAVLLGGLLIGRTVADPVFLTGRPAVPDPLTPGAFVQQTLASNQLSVTRPAGMIRGLERERAFSGDSLKLRGYLFGADLPSRVKLSLGGAGRTSRSQVVPLQKEVPGDVVTAAALLPAGIEAAVFEADLDVSALPSGMYRVTPILVDGEREVAKLRGRGLVLSRPSTSAMPWVFAGVALLALLLLALGAPAVPCACVLVGLVLVDLFRFADHFNPAVDARWDFPTTGGLRWLIENQSPEHPHRMFADPPATMIPANIATEYRLRDIRAYDSVDVYYYNQFLLPLVLSGDAGATRARLDAGTRMFDLLATRYQIAGRSTKPPAPHYREVYRGEVVIRENRRAFPRAFVARHAIGVDTLLKALKVDPSDPANRSMSAHALKLLANQGRIDLGRTVLVHAPHTLKTVTDLPAVKELLPPEPARFLVDDFDRVVIETDVPYNGFLFLADVWMPGWRCFVDGVETELVRADIAFRATPVPRGKHEVELRYEPMSVRLGAWISAGALASIVLLFVIGSLIPLPPRREGS